MKFIKYIILIALILGQVYASEFTLVFEKNLSALDDSSYDELDNIAQEILNSDNIKIVLVYAYASEMNTQKENISLSNRRAHAIKNELLLRAVPKGKIEILAMSDLYPLDNAQDSKRAIVKLIIDEIQKDDLIQDGCTTIFLPDAKSSLSDQTIKELEIFVDTIKNKSSQIILHSHIHSNGSSGYNKIISIEVAKQTVLELKKLGLSNIRVRTFGDEYPLTKSTNSKIRQFNTRLELKIK